MDPLTEGARLAALRSYGLLDAARPAVLDELTRLAASVFDTPMSAVTLIDEDRQWFAGKTGLAGDQTSLDISFCARVTADRQPLVVPDAREHPVFRGYDNVTGSPHVRFYAGAPLHDQDGYALGAVCVIDDRPRELGDRQRDMLVQFAGQAAAHVAALRSRLLLAELGDELSRAAGREEDLVATVSHELRTPVASIQGYLEMLTEDEALAPYRRLIEPIRRNGDRLVRMVDHLLAGTRPAGTALTVDRVPIDLVAVAEAAVAACHAQIAHRDVRCTIEVAGARVPVRGDFTRLAQAIEQLVRNAVTFSPAGGPVRVVVSYVSGSPAVHVTDDGIGIPAEELPHVTERFYRGRHSRGAAVGGVGLGLTIAHDIAVAHGGTLSVTSAGAGAGTTARLLLRPSAGV